MTMARSANGGQSTSSEVKNERFILFLRFVHYSDARYLLCGDLRKEKPMKTVQQDITCTHPHEDCFGRGQVYRTKCTVLTDCDFGGRDCPFYKNKKQYEVEKAELRARELERGIG